MATCVAFNYVLIAVISIAWTAAQESDKPNIYSLHIRSDIQYRFATTLITSRMANPSKWATEAVLDVILPNEAFVSNFTLEIDGVIYPANVKEKIKAEQEYQKAKKKGQSAGHIAQKPRETNKFKIKVAVAAFSKVTFNVTYQELLQRRRGIYQHKVYINPGQMVYDMKMDVAIQESRDISTLRVPPIRNDILTNDHLGAENSAAVITRPTPKSAFISYIPTLQDTTKFATGEATQFIIEYDIERAYDAGELLVVNGYFVHFIAPDISTQIPKDVLFIIDTSSSMRHGKMDQVKDAMGIILDELGEGDRFNIIEFSSGTHLYKKEMVEVDEDSIFKAEQYIKTLKSNGWTNINSALLDGINVLKEGQIAGERSPVIVFLTDGEATSGEQNTEKILKNVRHANEGYIPLFSLAFGSDADWGFVKKVAIQNNGVGKKIYTDSDAALQIAGFYDELAVTLLNNVTIKYLDDTVSEDSITQTNFKNYFKGSELIVAGKLEDLNMGSVNLEVISNSLDGQLVLSPDSKDNIIDFSDVSGIMKQSDFETITEKTWAYLTIKQLLKQVAGEVNATKKETMTERATELSLKYSFVTPLTSMVVTKPEIDVNAEEWQRKPTTTTTTTRRPPRRHYGGGGGGYSGGGGGDPHYLIRIKGIEHPICFDVKCKDGEVQNLLTDTANGITVNAKVIEGLKFDKYGEKKTFIGQISIQMAHHLIVVTPEAIFYDTKVFLWDDERVKHFGQNEFVLKNRGHMMSVRFKCGAEILIMRHLRHEREDKDVDYLNILIQNEDGFSKHTTGLIGQFVNSHKHIRLRKQWIGDGGKTMAKFQIKEWSNLKLSFDKQFQNSSTRPVRHVIRGNLVERSEIIDKGTEYCWMIHKPFDNELFGTRESFLVDDLLSL